jgi:nicotinamidase-related amidase
MPYLCEASRSTLIIIDLQEKLMPVIADGVDVVKRALLLAQVAKLLDIPVLGTVQQPLRLGRTVPAIQSMLDTSCEKVNFDACAEPAFLASLAPERNDLIVLGCEAHVCVLQTVLGLLHRKQRVKFVVDAIGSLQYANKLAAIDRAQSAGAEIVTSEMVIFEWMRNSDHPKFREILKLIK